MSVDSTLPGLVTFGVLFGTIVVTAVLSKATRFPLTAVEIVAGIILVGVFGFRLPAGLASLVTIGGLLMVFLAGFETSIEFLREHFRLALRVGVPGFALPFVGLLLLFVYGLHIPLTPAFIGATALADTSISIVYTTLQQYDLTRLQLGRFVLASTLVVNLAEDSVITGGTLFTTTALLFTVAVLGVLVLAALLLPRLTRALRDRMPADFSNVTIRALLLSLAVLGILSALVELPGILFVFLTGLILSRQSDDRFLEDARKVAFAFFVPLYFVAVGLRVDLEYVRTVLPLLGLIVVVATGLKLLGVGMPLRSLVARRTLGPVMVLMNTRLTSATVILLLTLTLGLISDQWYSLMLVCVVVLALGSTITLRALPQFRNHTSVTEAFSGELPSG